MKIIIFSLLLSFSSASLLAQIKNSSWKGAIKGDNPRETILTFLKDSATLYSASDKSTIERMTFSVKQGIITLHKIDGQSDCDNSTEGKYKYAVRGGLLSIALLTDPCDDRSSALNATKWTPAKK